MHETVDGGIAAVFLLHLLSLLTTEEKEGTTSNRAQGDDSHDNTGSDASRFGSTSGATALGVILTRSCHNDGLPGFSDYCSRPAGRGGTSGGRCTCRGCRKGRDTLLETGEINVVGILATAYNPVSKEKFRVPYFQSTLADSQVSLGHPLHGTLQSLSDVFADSGGSACPH